MFVLVRMATSGTEDAFPLYVFYKTTTGDCNMVAILTFVGRTDEFVGRSVVDGVKVTSLNLSR